MIVHAAAAFGSPPGLAASVGPAPDPEAWDALFTASATPHPHYAHHSVAAHQATGMLPEAVSFVTVHRGDRLAALLPFALRRDLTGLGGRVARPFLSPLVTATAPLVIDGPERASAVEALVAGLEQASGGRAWRWPL
ncbi:cellulose biosynthesis protein CelD, partial [Methylobacterium sp. WL18]